MKHNRQINTRKNMHVYYVYWSQCLFHKYEKLSLDPWHLEKPEGVMSTFNSTTGEGYAEVEKQFSEKSSLASVA